MSSSIVEEGELSESSSPGECQPTFIQTIESSANNEQTPLIESSSIKLENGLAKKRWFGCSLLSDFEVLDKVGEGTFGEVYQAKQRKSGKLVALKKILSRAEQEGFPITALREIKLLKSLKHPNVVEILDMVVDGEQDESIFMVFPYMDHDLTGLLATEEIRFSTPQIKCYTKQLLEGMRYLHSKRVLHRDVKGSNILINNRGEVKITDFGLARPLEENRKQYTPGVVTRWYRPPELLFGSTEYGPAVDMWGIGCILAEMHLKRPLFPGESDLDQLDHISKLCGSPTLENFPLGEKLPDFIKIKLTLYRRRLLEEFSKLMDPLAANLIDKLLVWDPDKRYTATQALQHAYFSNPPAPALPQNLPSYPSSHEYDRHKNKMMRAPHPTPHEPAARSPSIYHHHHHHHHQQEQEQQRHYYSRKRDQTVESQSQNQSRARFESHDHYYGRGRDDHKSFNRSLSRSQSRDRGRDEDQRREKDRRRDEDREHDHGRNYSRDRSRDLSRSRHHHRDRPSRSTSREYKDLDRHYYSLRDESIRSDKKLNKATTPKIEPSRNNDEKTHTLEPHHHSQNSYERRARRDYSDISYDRELEAHHDPQFKSKTKET